MHCTEGPGQFKFWISTEAYVSERHDIWLDESTHAAKLDCLVSQPGNEGQSRAEVNEIETATGMARPSWRKKMLPQSIERLADFNSQLEQLHAAHAELCHLQTVFKYLIDLSNFCVEASAFHADLGLQLGFPHLSKYKSTKYLEHVNFMTFRTDMFSAGYKRA